MEQKIDSWDFDKGTEAIDGKRTDFSNSEPRTNWQSYAKAKRQKHLNLDLIPHIKMNSTWITDHVCMCIEVFTCDFVHMCRSLCVWASVCQCMGMCTCVYVGCGCIYMHVCISTYASLHNCVSVCMLKRSGKLSRGYLDRSSSELDIYTWKFPADLQEVKQRE